MKFEKRSQLWTALDCRPGDSQGPFVRAAVSRGSGVQEVRGTL